jgi:hypothetical protein
MWWASRIPRPLLQQAFADDPAWIELTRRLPAAGLLDAAIADQIVASTKITIVGINRSRMTAVAASRTSITASMVQIVRDRLVRSVSPSARFSIMASAFRLPGVGWLVLPMLRACAVDQGEHVVSHGVGQNHRYLITVRDQGPDS